MVKTIKDDQPRTYFDCTKCPAFCCSIYERVQVTKRDITRLAKHFGVTFETARRRYTTQWENERILKKVEDVIFAETCMFLDQEKRGCTIYHARPDTGGLSGATPGEAVSWGKVDPERLPDAVVCYVDATIALPVITSYALARHEPRELKRLYDRRAELMDLLLAEYEKSERR